MENQKVRLIKTVVADAEPREREYVIWDSRVAGFGLRVRPTGARSFIFMYRTPGGRSGRTRKVTLRARHPDQAFEEAKKLSARYHGGGDPAGERADQKRAAAEARRTLSVSDVLDRFIADHAKENLADKTAVEYERISDRILKEHLGKVPVADLEPKRVAEMYHALRQTPTQAALAVRVLSSAMSWAEEFGLRPPGPNPAKIRLKAPRRRTRLFSDVEVARLQASVAALEADETLNPTVALGIRLLFATGCRGGEICQLRWSDIDLEEGLARWPNSKTGYLEKPLTGEARKLLKAAPRIVGVDWVCPSADTEKPLRIETLEAGFERVMDHANVEARENASLHLIRHWFATKIYGDASIPLPVQMKIVGHTSVATALRYSHPTREEVKRAAAGAAQRRAGAVRKAGKRGKVTTIRRASEN